MCEILMSCQACLEISFQRCRGTVVRQDTEDEETPVSCWFQERWMIEKTKSLTLENYKAVDAGVVSVVVRNQGPRVCIILCD